MNSNRTRSRFLPSIRSIRIGQLPVYFACFILVLATLGSVGAGVLAPYDPNQQSLTSRLLAPAWLEGGTLEHLLGTDPLGRDVLSRLLHGGRVTLLVAIVAVTLSALLGTTLGLLAGYYRGRVDEVIMRVADVQLAVPVLLLAITLIAILDVSLQNIIVVLALSGWVPYARILRSQVLSVREREFIQAAWTLGASHGRIIFRHILPNVMNTCLVLATLDAANMMILEAALSFLGLGVRPPALSWGSVMGDGRDYISTSWWIVTFPGLAISLVILSINLLGDTLRDHLDPQLRT